MKVMTVDEIDEVLSREYPELARNPDGPQGVQHHRYMARLAKESAAFRLGRAKDEIWGEAERARWLQAAWVAIAEFEHYRNMAKLMEAS